ncbi:MAG: ImmA/IrrE family metallo-endopeptidase [Akkermansiaceae bacterium]
MKKSQREHLSRSDITDRVNSMLFALFGDACDLRKPADIKKILEILTTQNWVDFSDHEDLGFSSLESKVRGMFTVEPNRIRICSTLERWSAEYNFVLAHEIGHLALHRKMIGKGKFIDRSSIPADTAEELKYRDKATLSDLGWIEWQANEFAISLILPSAYLSYEVYKKQTEMDIKSRRGIIYFDDQIENQMHAKIIVDSIANDYFVKSDLLWKRLRFLGILQDHRVKVVNVPYDCLKGLFYS